MIDRITPPHVDEIFGPEPTPHPLDVLSLDGIDAAREGYRQARDYRDMYLAAIRVAHTMHAAACRAIADRDAARAEVRRLAREAK